MSKPGKNKPPAPDKASDKAKSPKGPWEPVEDIPFLADSQNPDVLDDLFDSQPAPKLKDPVQLGSPAGAKTQTASKKSEDLTRGNVEADDQITSDADGPETSPRVPRGSRVATMRAAAEAAAVTQSEDVREVAERAAFDQRITSQDRLFSHVDRILGLINQEPDLQQWANTIVLSRDPEVDRRQRSELEARVSPRMLDARIMLESSAEAKLVFDLTYDELTGISILGDLWREADVDEICIDAWDKIAVERRGRLERTGYRFRSPQHAQAVARQLSQKISDRGVSNVNSLVTAQLPQARVQFVYGPLSSHGLAITIRKFRPLLGMEKLLEFGALTPEMADFLAACVRSRATIVVSGGTGTGKTTAINALSESIPDDERVITIEDAFELQLSNTHVVSLQAKQKATADDTVVVSQADLLVASLRMRPDRIVVGEIREPSAAAVFFDAANTGHDGSMTTIHADSATSALNNRLAALLMRSHGGFSEDVARESVAQAVQVVIQITRHHSGRRIFSEISIVDPHYRSNGGIKPFAMFRAEILPTGESKHVRLGSVGADTQLAGKLRDAGEDIERWIQG
jgi:pilus assembly protein CpaF